MKLLTTLKLHWSKIFSILLFIALLGSYANIFAIGQPYNPGETLDPLCPPGEINCTVLITSGGSMVYPLSGIASSNGTAWDTSYSTIGSGTVLALATTPTFTTSITTPLILGGTGTTQDLSLQTTSGIGNTGADMHFLVGNNGATEAMTILNNGNIGIGTNSPTIKLTVSSTDFDVASFRRTVSGGGGTINFINGNNQTWGFGSGGNFNEFFISDRDNLTFPFRIEKTTPNNSFYIKNNGNIGIGTGNPASKLEINLSRNNSYVEFFGGLGLEDATFSGQNGSVPNSFYVIITQEGNPDSFEFYDENGECDYQPSTPITGFEQFLCNDIYISFNSITGHTLGDNWGYEQANVLVDSGPILTIKDSVDNYFIVNAIAKDSNFLGYSSGYGATMAHDSNFLGYYSGYQATSAESSNFLGYYSGYEANQARDSNFFGYYSGYEAYLASNSNFLGYSSGYGATNAAQSNFMGPNSGSGAINASHSNFFGSNAGQDATDASFSNFLGPYSGYQATNAYYSNFFGYQAGYQANDPNYFDEYAEAAYYSNFFGYQAGYQASRAKKSNFLGSRAGYGATTAENSNFLGWDAGYLATNASSSNFIGLFAGTSASEATQSNFIGYATGRIATNATFSNFIGSRTGWSATNAHHSNFFGYSSGRDATNAYHSNFFGNQAGQTATNASNSIFIGQNSGYLDAVNNTGDFNNFSILIGKSTSTGGFSNSIALGGSAVNTATNQFMIGSSTRPINTTVWTGASGTATLDTATGLITTSDERLKKNIVDLEDTTLSKLINVRTVKFNWLNGNSDKTNIGFLAQDLEQYFPEVVYTGTDDYKGVNYANMTPIIVEAIREMDLKVKNINDFETENNWRDNIIIWFGNTTNGITEFVAGIVRAKDKLCIGEGEDEVCITKEELLQIKINSKIEETERIILPDPTISVDPIETAKEVEEKKEDEKVDFSTEELEDELSEKQNKKEGEVVEEDEKPIEEGSSSDIII